MITDLDLCDLAALAYSPATLETNDCHILLTKKDDVTVVSFRGTDPSKLIDLWRDADALTYNDPKLGPVHDGFYWDVCSVAWRLIPILTGPFVIDGHSKGGSEALLFGGMCVAIGLNPLRLTTFGAALSGGPILGQLLKYIPGNDYWNGGDPIPLSSHKPRPLHYIGERRLTFDAISDHSILAYRGSLVKTLA